MGFTIVVDEKSLDGVHLRPATACNWVGCKCCLAQNNVFAHVDAETVRICKYEPCEVNNSTPYLIFVGYMRPDAVRWVVMGLCSMTVSVANHGRTLQNKYLFTNISECYNNLQSVIYGIDLRDKKKN